MPLKERNLGDSKLSYYLKYGSGYSNIHKTGCPIPVSKLRAFFGWLTQKQKWACGIGQYTMKQSEEEEEEGDGETTSEDEGGDIRTLAVATGGNAGALE